MIELNLLLNKVGLVIELDNNTYKGNSCNVRTWPVFRVWINKSNKLTVKTHGIQKSFNDWNELESFKEILKGFEIL